MRESFKRASKEVQNRFKRGSTEVQKRFQRGNQRGVEVPERQPERDGRASVMPGEVQERY